MYKNKIKEIRTALGLSVAKLAEKINVPARTITSYEQGERTPSIEFLTKLCMNFDIDPNYFLFNKGQMFLQKCENTHIFIKNEKSIKNFKCWGKRLGMLLTENEETPYTFSKRTGIKESRIEKFILDSIEPTISEINAIKCNVDVSIDELLYGETVEKNTQAGNNISLSTDEILKIKQLLNKSND